MIKAMKMSDVMVHAWRKLQMSINFLSGTGNPDLEDDIIKLYLKLKLYEA